MSIKATKTTIGGELRYTTMGRVILITFGDWGHWLWTDEEFKDDGPDNPLMGTFESHHRLSDIFAEINCEIDEYLIETAKR